MCGAMWCGVTLWYGVECCVVMSRDGVCVSVVSCVRGRGRGDMGHRHAHVRDMIRRARRDTLQVESNKHKG